jgi:hypothetical protein
MEPLATINHSVHQTQNTGQGEELTVLFVLFEERVEVAVSRIHVRGSNILCDYGSMTHGRRT